MEARIMKEEWKDIPNYEGLYKVSNLGIVKSLERKVKSPRGFRTAKEKILKAGLRSQYISVALCRDGNIKSFNVQILVAMAFLNHKPNGHGLVINHINFDSLDNRLENLEIVTQRENTNKKHIESTSKYTGVSWDEPRGKWKAQI